MTCSVHVIGATGRTGAALCRRLVAAGVPMVAVVRNPAKWAAFGLDAPALAADAADLSALRGALAGASRVVSTVHANFTHNILQAAPQARLVLMGSTRIYSKWRDAHGQAVAAAEAALLASRANGVMLHPTMIYGDPMDATVQRLAALLRRWRIIPLPGFGASLVQPIHQTDVAGALHAALDIDWQGPHAMVIAGPTALPYRKFVRAVAAACGSRTPIILPLPAFLLFVIARLPFMPAIRADEIRRLLEDKDFDISGMQRILGVQPMPLEQGLACSFAAAHKQLP